MTEESNSSRNGTQHDSPGFPSKKFGRLLVRRGYEFSLADKIGEGERVVFAAVANSLPQPPMSTVSGGDIAGWPRRLFIAPLQR